MGIIIKSFGHFLPETSVSSKELADRFGFSEEWVVERVGIYERKYFEEGATSDMAIQAAKKCLDIARIDVNEVDCIIVATITPDHLCPSTASIVHSGLGTVNAWAFDIAAACSGFVYGLNLAASLVETHQYKNVLVVGADKMTSCIDFGDSKTTLLLGDGAGACLIGYNEHDSQLLAINCKLHSRNWRDIVVPDGGSRNPGGSDRYLRFLSKNNFLNGKNIFVQSIKETLTINNLTIKDIDYIVPHQSNKRMLELIARELEIPLAKFIINIDWIGNTSAASIPLTISESLVRGILRKGDKILIVSVGAGFTIGSAILIL